MPTIRKDKEVFAKKIKINMGDIGTFSGIAMNTGVPEGKPYYYFREESLKSQIGKIVKLTMDHNEKKTLSNVGYAEFTGVEGNNLMFDAQLLMDAKDISDNLYPRLKDGLIDGLSVNVVFTEFARDAIGEVVLKNNKYLDVISFDIEDLTITPTPAFKKARIKNVFSDDEKLELQDKVKRLFMEAGVEIEDKISFEDLKRLTTRNFEIILKEIGFSNSVAEKLSGLQGELGDTKGQGELDEFGAYLQEYIETNNKQT